VPNRQCGHFDSYTPTIATIQKANNAGDVADATSALNLKRVPFLVVLAASDNQGKNFMCVHSAVQHGHLRVNSAL
jgi:hypothetical protein